MINRKNVRSLCLFDFGRDFIWPHMSSGRLFEFSYFLRVDVTTVNSANDAFYAANCLTKYLMSPGFDEITYFPIRILCISQIKDRKNNVDYIIT